MRCTLRSVITAIVLTSSTFYMISYVWNADPFKDTSNLIFRGRNRIQIGVVICNSEAANLFKTLSSTLALMSISEIDVHIVVDGDEIKKEVEKQYAHLHGEIRLRMTYHFYKTWFPAGAWWKSSYKLCAAEKLFLPNIIKGVDEILVLDVDAIIVNRLEKIWRELLKTKSNQMMAAAPSCGFDGCPYYEKIKSGEAHVPVVWEAGLAGGVVFMKLQMMRDEDFVQKAIDVGNDNQNRLPYIDQDILNIYFSAQSNKDRLRRLDCAYNFMPWFYCPDPNVCDLSQGVMIVHENSRLHDTTFDHFRRVLEQLNDISRGPETIIKDIILELKTFKRKDSCDNIIDKIFWY